MEIKSIWFLTHMYKHSLFLKIIDAKCPNFDDFSKETPVRDKAKIEFCARFFENYRKVLSFL